MKYVAPYGATDPNQGYINGDPSIARKGSIPPAAVFEHPQREIMGVITKSDWVPDELDLLQLTKSVRSQFINFADDTGSQNTLSVAFDPPIEFYTVGLPIRVRVKISNNGACTIDAGAGRVNIRRPSGAALQIGDLTAGGLVDLVYDGTVFQMINFGGAGEGDITNNYNNIPYCVDVGTPNNIVAPFSPAITTLAAGDPILVKIAHNNSGPTRIQVNALPQKDVKATPGGHLLPEDIVAGSVVLMVFDGTDFYVEPNTTINAAYTVNVPSTQFNTVDSVFDAFSRKIIGNDGYMTVQLAVGVFPGFSVYHTNTKKWTVRGTMIAAAPTVGHFAQNGASAAVRASDGAYNLAMLRARYGTEIRLDSTVEGIGIRVGFGSIPTFQDLLIVHGNPAINAAGIGDQSCICINVAVWGCRSGIYADANGLIGITACWVCWALYGFSATHGGSMGFSSVPSGAFGCEEAGFYASSQGYMLLNNTYSRCNGHYGYSCSELSMMGGTNVDGLYNGICDLIVSRLSEITVTGLTATSSSPAVNTWGNNNAIIFAS